MNYVTRTMLVSMVVNIFLSIVKILTGLIGKSGALIADGVHSFSDLVTDVVAIVGGKIANKPVDKNHPYGHGKVEYITSILISIVILILGFTIILKSFNNDVSTPTKLVIFVTVFTILAKLLLSNFVLKKGIEHNSNILISSGYESRSDVLSSIIVLVSTFLFQLSKVVPIFKYADKISMMIVGIFILKNGFGLLKENISNILGESEINTDFSNLVENIILNFDEVKQIDELVLIKYGSYYKMISDIGMNETMLLKDVHDTLDKIELEIKNKTNIRFITFHVNPYT